MAINYFLALIASFLLSVFFTILVKKIAWKFKILDQPGGERKIHRRPIPLLGGWAIFIAFFLVLGYLSFFTNLIIGRNILLRYLVGIFIGGLFLMIGGTLDDRFNLKPSRQIIWPILAALGVMISGIGISFITNPLGGILRLDFYTINWGGYNFFILTNLFTFVWLLGIMYTTKFLDGLDGLVSGITAIGSLIIFFLSLAPEVNQTDTAFLAIILVGACLGFLIFNFYPASIFLGEGGSLFTGFMLGILAIIAGGKIATALLILGLPILDVGWVILRRLFWDKKRLGLGDEKHLHFRLIKFGFSQRQAVLFLYFLTTVFGVLALFLQSKEKLIALVVLGLVMVILALVLTLNYRART